MTVQDQSFTGSCPTCGQKYLGAEVGRLRALLQKIEDLAGSDSLEALDEAIAIAKLAHEQNVSGEVK